MVTLLDERGVVPLLRVAVKVTAWPTAGAVVDGERVVVVVVCAPLPTLTLTTLLVEVW